MVLTNTCIFVWYARIIMGIICSIFRIVDIPGKRDKRGWAEGVQALIVCLTCNIFPKERSIVNVEIWSIYKVLICMGCQIISVLFCLLLSVTLHGAKCLGLLKCSILKIWIFIWVCKFLFWTLPVFINNNTNKYIDICFILLKIF